MYDINMLVWGWMLVGVIAFLRGNENLSGQTSLLQLAALVVTWPLWIFHRERRAGDKDRPQVAPIRIVVEKDQRRARKK